MLRNSLNPLVLSVALLGLPALAQEKELVNTKFEGLYADVGLGYRNINTSNSSSLQLNGRVVPSSVSSSGSSHTLAVLTAGYNFNITQHYYLGVGANISPSNGLTQQIQIQALNRTTTVSGATPLYNYGFFLSPGVETEYGLIYLKAGKQTQVVNSNTGFNLNGYLLGLGYKQFVHDSIYLFGEVNYSSYDSQTTTRTIAYLGQTLNASVTTSGQTTRLLLGLGYQF
jgi:opacity protein-like surface antigen